MMRARISTVILTMNAEHNIAQLLDALHRQTVCPDEVIVADSESADNTVALAMERGARVLPIERKTFNHGGTRDAVLRQSNGDYVLFLTHDAIPADVYLIERLLNTLEDCPKMAVAYARQLPRQDATAMERLIRTYNYPAVSHAYEAKDIPTRGIKAFFMSDVCALYRRAAYETIGGFETDIKTNEDMFFAAKAIKKGFSVGYAAEAKAIHSHNFSLKEQYRRNYIQGYEIERHRELLSLENGECISQNDEGMKLVKFVTKELLFKGKVLSWICFGFDCCARYAGNYMGKKQARKEADRH